MHIGLIGRHGRDYFQDNIGHGLTSLGHRVTHLGVRGFDQGSLEALRFTRRVVRTLPQLEERLHHRKLARAALAQECDAVISTRGTLSVEAVAILRRNRVPVGLWFPDSVSNMGRQTMFAAPYTAYFFKDPLWVQRLSSNQGLPAWYLPQGCNPSWHRPVGEAGVDRTVVIAGNVYPTRALLLRRLHQAGVPLTVYGGPIPRTVRDILPNGIHAARSVFREDKSRVFRQAAAVLNNLLPSEMDGTNARLFEATAAGGAVLCEYRPALDELFDAGTEIVPYHDFDELLSRIRALLDDPQLGVKIGDAASRRSHGDHTYARRLPLLLERLL